MPNFPKKQQQCLIPKYLLDYATDLQENHPDPSAEWGGGSGGDTIQAGTGIVITTESDDTKTISVDTEDVAMVASLSSVAFSGDYDDLTNKPTIPTNYVTTDTAQDITDYKRFTGQQQYDDYTTISNDRVLVTNYSGDRSTRMENERVAAHYSWMGNTENMELWADGIHYTKVNDNSDATTVTLNFNVNPYENETYYITFQSKNGTVALTSDIITSYNDLEDKPTIPTATSDLYNDSGFITGITSSDVTTALGYTPYSNANPDGYITSSALSGYATEYWVGQQGYLTSVTWNDVSGKPTFATVATSGDYNDLINKPTIPAGITILDISTSVTFTATQIADFIANPGNYLFKESDWANGDDYFRINTVMSGAIRLTKTYVNSSTSLSSEVFHINRSTGAVTKSNYSISIPTTATSTSTVTPTTETLVFTYTDNTTATITIMTGATVSTTTTLS